MARMHPGSKRRHVRVVLVALLGLHGGLLAWSATRHSPVVSEVNHLPAGLSHLYLGRFGLYYVNPPLVRMVAALPVTLMSPATDWRSYDPSPLARSDLEVGQDFLKANGPRSFCLFVLARWACIPFGVLGGYICYRWARELYGMHAGVLALTLWCFCPYVLGHGSLFTPDAHAAAIGVTACYLFWRWLVHPGFQEAAFAGITLGLAESAKFTLLVFYPLWTLTWLVYALPDPRRRNPKSWLREGGTLLGIVLLSVVVINLVYEFQASFQPLGQYQFRSQLLKGTESRPEALGAKGNRFSGTWLASWPVPVPADYLQGIDAQRWDFERKQWSYLGGEWRLGGWWYYYLAALGIKLPLGTWCLIVISVFCSVRSQYRSSWRNEVVLPLSVIGILALVSSQTGFSIHSRYVLPILPLVYVWCSRAARSMEARHRIVALGTALALCWSVGDSLQVYPHNLSYFNELAGGPRGGHACLLDSNIAWGQDLCFLRRWLDDHPDARPFHLAYYGLMDPRLVGIEFTLPPLGPASGASGRHALSDESGPLPGWYAVDMNHLHGAKLTADDGRGSRQWLADGRRDLTYFQQFKPLAMAGYSLYIYHITREEANRVRGKLGLPDLPQERPLRGD